MISPILFGYNRIKESLALLTLVSIYSVIDLQGDDHEADLGAILGKGVVAFPGRIGTRGERKGRELVSLGGVAREDEMRLSSEEELLDPLEILEEGSVAGFGPVESGFIVGKAVPLVVDMGGETQSAKGKLGGVAEGIFGKMALQQSGLLGEQFADAGEIGEIGGVHHVLKKGEEFFRIAIEGLAADREAGTAHIWVLLCHMQRKKRFDATGMGLLVGEGFGVVSAAAAYLPDES